MLQYGDSEHAPPPQLRAYDDFIAAGTTAEITNQPTAGVKGIWVLHRLPYACHIHWTVDMMHTLANVIHDTLDSMRPTNSGTVHLYKHNNRSYCENVMRACESERIFHDPFDDLDERTLPPWCLNKNECGEVDKRMNHIIGRVDSDNIPKNIMRTGKGKKSHDTIVWATTFAAWCLRGFGPYIDHAIELFDQMGKFSASYLWTSLVEGEAYNEFIECLVKREGMMPPSEATATFHELFHLQKQLIEVGCPRHSTLYKFEKMNKILKRGLKNTAKGKT